MAFELMYITNHTDVALAAEAAGVDRIWVDLETLGKEERQKNFDSVKSHHSLEDIAAIKSVLTKSKLQVRVNPVYEGSEAEIDQAITNGADILMLPMFKTVTEVEKFVDMVNGRAKVLLLLETREAEEIIDDILEVKGIDEIHIGLNDLHISHHLDFMFELMINGVVDGLCEKIRKKGIPFGIGGIAALGQGTLPADMIFAEDWKQGCSRVILSRGFIQPEEDMERFAKVFKERVQDLRNYEKSLSEKKKDFFESNKEQMKAIIENIVESGRKA